LYNVVSFPSTAVQFKEWYLGEYTNLTLGEDETLAEKWLTFNVTLLERI
jgi:hypothetical protein